MKRCFAGLTDTGIVRTVNQDSYYIDESQGRFFIVADGMGGHAGGQEASRIATKRIQEHLEKHWDNLDIPSENLLKDAIDKANQGILEDQSNNPERRDMGTTVVVTIFRDRPLCAHVGDSRLYRWRDSKLEQVTDDHTWVSLALRSGEISKEQAKVHPWRHVLSQCLGRKDLYNIELQELDVQAGDQLLMCSDGLTEEVSDEEIQNCLSQSEDYKQAVEKLIIAAKEAGGSDNITVVIVGEE
ncbi:MAG: Stp1/IreP family PP2C-type Ser/Thr phosphatase [Xenococcaceae cyanobacterium MO_167.B52]|nr:Stp1/IreP family PP2C-type Ser/Thr phosphatase [Xenococcaceae cyanobacterium MO_167.B52]